MSKSKPVIKAAIRQQKNRYKELVVSLSPLDFRVIDDGKQVELNKYFGETDVMLDFGTFSVPLSISIRAYAKIPFKYHRIMSFSAKRERCLKCRHSIKNS